MMNKILRLFRKKKNDENEYPNRIDTLEQDSAESYKNFKSPGPRRFSHPTPLGKRNLNQLPKIITDPTQLAIIGDYNRRNNNVFNNNNRHSSYNRNDFDFEKLIEIRKAIINQKVKPMKTSGICPKCYNPIAEFENISKDFFINLRKYLNSEINNGLYISRYYGITRDPSTNNYMMVVQYACDGDLRKYYEQNSTSLTWQKRLNILHGITAALTRIHKNDLAHQNLHSGSVLIHSSMMVLLSDLGFYKLQNNINEGLYCNLPFTAPETLQNILVTKESNIYSFGLIMWELAYCKKPFSDRSHDLSFAIDICNGVHPELNCDIPECYVDLMKQCLSLDPFMRPTAEQLYKTLGEWLCLLLNVSNSDIAEQFHEANERLALFDKTLEDHPEAIYNSRFYNFKGFEPSSEPSFQPSL
ncbi:kinase-like protein [Gigaspora margarita]|uniref:Kinase-like protein n=1 Tax=Gigaspora margarita TaxID=4874 RepID=A0A8H4AY09_GIGMA|nr:kinase-like protein [Gigaspora margarita]